MPGRLSYIVWLMIAFVTMSLSCGKRGGKKVTKKVIPENEVKNGR
ncbi:hypothetical protein ACFL5B_01205 [Candidatus Latescibacterota bacterium]